MVNKIRIFEERKSIYVVLFFVYLTVELIYGFHAGIFAKNLVLYGDALFYSTAGWNMSRGLGYTFDGKTPNATYQFGYPLFLSLLFKVFGNDTRIVFIVQCLMAACSFVLFYCIIAEITRNKLLKIISLFLYFTHHIIFYLNSYFISEPLGIFTFLIFILAAVKYFKHKKNTYLVWASIACGYLILTRNVFQLLPIFLLIFSLAGKKKFLKECFLLVLVSFVIISPYVIRNKVIFGSYKLSFNAGRNFLNVAAFIPGAESARLSEQFVKDPAQADQEYFSIALKEAFTHPLRTLKIIVRNSIFLLFLFDISAQNMHYSNLKFFLVIKNIIVFIFIIFYSSRKKTFIGCVKRVDFVFIALTFFYYHLMASLCVCDGGRFGVFLQILLYFVFVSISDQYLNNQRKDHMLVPVNAKA
jgi:4-amino-4-deoxy-L-arabinose transferase-like glycosyltransferase